MSGFVSSSSNARLLNLLLDQLKTAQGVNRKKLADIHKQLTRMPGMDVHLLSGSGNGVTAAFSENGELLIRTFKHSTVTIKKLTGTTVTNFIEPVAGEQTILTGMYASADRSINNSGDVLEIYESDAATDGTQTKLLFSVDLARQGDSGPAFPTTEVTVGRFVNADRTNATGTITVSLWSYQIEVVKE